MQVDSLLIKRKLDEATTEMRKPNGDRPPPYATINVEFTYGELMMIWDAISLRDAIRDIAKD